MIYKIKRALRYLFFNRTQFCDSIICNYLKFLPDKLYLSLRYRCAMGYWMDWKNPKSFSEKLQWLKIYNRLPVYTTMVDKLAVKKYVADIIGKEYIIPTLGVWDKPEDIDWDMLPDKFVLKTTHGGGSNGVVICKDKMNFDKYKAIDKLNKSLKSDIYLNYREWPYKNVYKRIIAEKYIASTIEDIPDFKFYCFDGKPKYCQVIRNRRTNETIDFYDMNWVHQDFVGVIPVQNTFEPLIGNGNVPVSCPKRLSEMIYICKKLSKGIPFARIDLYDVNDLVYFGEITFFPASGFGGFSKKVWNYKLGEFIKLPLI